MTEHFKKVLVAKRKALGLSQYQLSVELGTSQSKVNAWEQGHNWPHVNSLIKLADFFNCTLDELVGRESKENNNDN